MVNENPKKHRMCLYLHDIFILVKELSKSMLWKIGHSLYLGLAYLKYIKAYFLTPLLMCFKPQSMFVALFNKLFKSL